MPFSGINSYIPTIDEFLAHWNSVDHTLDDPMLLAGGYDRDDLTADRQAMQTILSVQEKLDNNLGVLQAQRDQRRAALLERFSQLRAAIAVYVKDSPYAGNLPDKPGRNAGPAVVLKALDDANSVWTQINTATIPGFTGPLTLRGGFTLADFQAELEALRDTYPELVQAQNAVALNRRQREALYQKIRGLLIDYRKAVELNFAADAPLVETLPALTPPPGSTPDKPAAAGAWDAAALKARIEVTPPDDPRVTAHQLRTSPDDPYRSDTERVVLTQPVEQTTFLTNDGLTVPGTAARFKVYALTATGNEAGSDVLRIERPTGAQP